MEVAIGLNVVIYFMGVVMLAMVGYAILIGLKFVVDLFNDRS